MKSNLLKTKKKTKAEAIETSEDELDTKDLLEPLDEESSSEDETEADAKATQLKLDNKVRSKTKATNQEEAVVGMFMLLLIVPFHSKYQSFHHISRKGDTREA